MGRDEERAIEWDCEQVLRRYYNLVHRRELDQAVGLFTQDADWHALGVDLKGREAILEGLRGGFASGTVRHTVTGTVISVIDRENVESVYCNCVFNAPGIRIEDRKTPIPMEGPSLVVDVVDRLVRTNEGWKIARRRGTVVFKRQANQLLPFEAWAQKEGKIVADA